jgi:hypothetical protein
MRVLRKPFQLLPIYKGIEVEKSYNFSSMLPPSKHSVSDSHHLLLRLRIQLLNLHQVPSLYKWNSSTTSCTNSSQSYCPTIGSSTCPRTKATQRPTIAEFLIGFMLPPAQLNDNKSTMNFKLSLSDISIAGKHSTTD